MTVMQRDSWLAAYGGVLGSDMLAQLAVTDHLQIWRRRLAEPGPVPMLICRDEVVIGLHQARGLVVTLDPSEGWRQNTLAGFLHEWKVAGYVTLVVSAKS